MIAPDVEPIGRRAPYKRIDLAQPRRKAVITRADVIASDMVPDPALYDYDHIYDVWTLKP